MGIGHFLSVEHSNFSFQRPSGDELKDFFCNLQRHMKRKKKLHASAAEVLQEHAPHIIGDHVPTKHPPGKVEDTRHSPAAKQRHAAVRCAY